MPSSLMIVWQNICPLPIDDVILSCGKVGDRRLVICALWYSLVAWSVIADWLYVLSDTLVWHHRWLQTGYLCSLILSCGMVGDCRLVICALWYSGVVWSVIADLLYVLCYVLWALQVNCCGGHCLRPSDILYSCLEGSVSFTYVWL